MPLKSSETIYESRKWYFKYFAKLFPLGVPDNSQKGTRGLNLPVSFHESRRCKVQRKFCFTSTCSTEKSLAKCDHDGTVSNVNRNKEYNLLIDGEKRIEVGLLKKERIQLRPKHQKDRIRVIDSSARTKIKFWWRNTIVYQSVVLFVIVLVAYSLFLFSFDWVSPWDLQLAN